MRECVVVGLPKSKISFPSCCFIALMLSVMLLLIIGAQKAMAIEEATYVVLKSEGKFEVREYAPHVLAETLVEGDLENAGSRAFQKLFRYFRASVKV